MYEEFIKKECVRSDGRISSWAGNQRWWDNRGYGDLLTSMRASVQLPPDSTITEVLYCVLNSMSSRPTCSCGKEIEWRNGYRTFCSNACASRDPRVIAKITQRSRATLKRRYGCENPYQIKHVRERISKTQRGVPKLTIRGNNHHTRRHLTPEQRALLEDPTRAYEEHLGGKSVYAVAGEAGFTSCVLHLALNRNGMKPVRHAVSGPHLRICELLDSLGVKYSKNDRDVIGPLELDVYSPESSLAIEVNGTYWHSLKNDPKYHLNKTEACSRAGVKLIHLTDRQVNEKWSICKSMITHALGKSVRINARDLVKDGHVTNSEYRAFCEENHLEGYASASVKLGLRNETGELIAVMSFNRDRFSDKDWELVRLCTKVGFHSPGAASRLWSMRPFGSIVSYSHRDQYIGGVYSKLGFRHDGFTVPGYFWVNCRGDTLSRYQTFKSRLPKLLGDSFDPALSEVENMERAGYRRYWNCGNTRWVLDK